MKFISYTLPYGTTYSPELLKAHFLDFRKSLYWKIRYIQLEISIKRHIDWQFRGESHIDPSNIVKESLFQYYHIDNVIVIKLRGNSVGDFLDFIDEEFIIQKELCGNHEVFIREIEFKYKILSKEQYNEMESCEKYFKF